jgi:hypothetical protein
MNRTTRVMNTTIDSDEERESARSGYSYVMLSPSLMSCDDKDNSP